MNIQNITLWTAIVTPFTADASSIDYESFEKLLRLQEKAGNGIVLLGSTGEGLALNDKERTEVVDFACSLKLQVPLMVGTPTYNHEAASNWIKQTSNKSIHSFLIVTPLYSKPGARGEYHWYKSLLDLAKKPCVLYNIPSRTGVELHRETLNALRGHANLWAIKESSGSMETVHMLRRDFSEITLFCGDDNLFPDFATHGARGLISVAANIWPQACARFVTEILSKKPTLDYETWWDISKSLYCATNPIPTKYLLKHLGKIPHNSVRLPLSVEDIKSDTELIRANEIIHSWEGSNR